MALGLGKRTARQQSLTQEPGAILPLIEEPEYRAIAAKKRELERLLSEKFERRDELQDQRRQLRSSSFVDFLTTEFLSGGSDAGGASLPEQIALVNDELHALQKAIELASQEQAKVRGQRSSQMRESHFPAYRQHVRLVLAGMLAMQAANDAVQNLRENLDAAGYAAGVFAPFGLAPWPYWGSIEDLSSVWIMHLTDLLDRSIIDRDEFVSLTNGEVAAFRA